MLSIEKPSRYIAPKVAMIEIGTASARDQGRGEPAEGRGRSRAPPARSSAPA